MAKTKKKQSKSKPKKKLVKSKKTAKKTAVQKAKNKIDTNHCAWCGSYIAGESEAFGFGVTARPEVDLSKYRGGMMDIDLISLKKTIPAIVVGLNSQAARQGHDMYFMTCSKSCAKKLNDAIEREVVELNAVFDS